MNKYRYAIAALAVILGATGVALAGMSSSDKADKSVRYKINATGGSGQHGTVTLTDAGANKTKVTIKITGEPASASEPAHIHVGTCPLPGAVKWPLSNVVHGSSVTTVNAPMDQVDAAGLAVNIHRNGAIPPPYKACGTIKG